MAVKSPERPAWLAAVCREIALREAGAGQAEIRRWQHLSDAEKLAEMAATVRRWRRAGLPTVDLLAREVLD